MDKNIAHAEDLPGTKRKMQKKYARAFGTKMKLQKTDIAFAIFT